VIENRRYWVFFCRSNFSNKVLRTKSTTAGWLPVLPAHPICVVNLLRFSTGFLSAIFVLQQTHNYSGKCVNDRKVALHRFPVKKRLSMLWTNRMSRKNWKPTVCELVLIPNYYNYISMRLSSHAHKNLHLKNFVFYTVENITHLK
jgi:hypothetical protein